MQQNTVTPNALFIPAEWAPHASTWMVWPHNKTLWESGWGVALENVQVDFARVASDGAQNALNEKKDTACLRVVIS